MKKKITIFIIFFSLITPTINTNFVYFSNNENYQKNFRDFIKEFYESNLPDSVKLKILNENLKALKKILSSVQKNSVLFLTHGIITKKSPSDYFFNSDGIRDNEKYMKTLANIIGAKYYYFLRWEGKINFETRLKAAKDFVALIETKLKEISLITGVEEKKIPINLAGHSFGGSIFILTSNILKAKGYNVQLLFTFNCASNEYQLLYNEIYHINFFSYNDWLVRLFGSIYLGERLKLLIFGPSKVTFKNAINICLDYAIKNNDFLFLKKNGKEDLKIKLNIYHHAIRNEKIWQLIMQSDKYLEKVTQNVSSKAKWSGKYTYKNITIELIEDNDGVIVNLNNEKTFKIYYRDTSKCYIKRNIPFFPFFSSGYLKEKFIMNEEVFYYYLKIKVFILPKKEVILLKIKFNKKKGKNPLIVSEKNINFIL